MAERASPSLIADLQDLVAEALASRRGVSRRRVLASDGWFVNGRLFTLVNRQARIVVRLPDQAAQDELLQIRGTGQWTIGAKMPMRGWLLLPESAHDDSALLSAWLTRAFTLAESAPATTPKPRRPTAGSKQDPPARRRSRMTQPPATPKRRTKQGGSTRKARR